MTRVIHTVSVPCAVAAMLMMSVPAFSQASANQPTPARAQAAPGQNAGQALMDARKALNAVLNTPAPDQQLFEKLSSIKTHYLELETAYSARGDWQSHYAAINQTLSELLGAPTATGTASSSTATTGATGTSGTTAPAKLDANAINNLQAFRKALNDFSLAMGSTSGSSPSAAPTNPPPSATAGATGTTGSSTTVTTATGTTGTTANPPATSASAAPATPSEPAAASVDPHVAEIARLIGIALSPSATTAANADTICVDRKTLQEIQMHVMQLQAGKKPQ